MNAQPSGQEKWENFGHYIAVDGIGRIGVAESYEQAKLICERHNASLSQPSEDTERLVEKLRVAINDEIGHYESTHSPLERGACDAVLARVIDVIDAARS